MPELPEVETVRRGLLPAVEGADIVHAQINRPNLRFAFPDQMAKRLTGQRVISLSRRAKYLLWHLADGTVMIVHLGMSGSFRVGPLAGDASIIADQHFTHKRSQDRKHDHVQLIMRQADGRLYDIVYNDPRRFGFMLFQEPNSIEHPLLAPLGIEPTGNRLDGDILAGLFKGKNTPLKAALLDQKLIAGLGNIYVCEALWRAGLAPNAPAKTLVTPSGKARPKAYLLADVIRTVIAEAIEAGGSSLRDHRQTDGEMGYFQHHFAVYGQEGAPCPKAECGGIIDRIAQSGRSTFYCPQCQR